MAAAGSKPGMRMRSLAFLLVLFSLWWAGCAPNDTREGRGLSTGGATASSRVTLELWTISLKPKFTAYMESVLAEFSQQHPGVEVEWVDLPQKSILQKFMAAIAGGVPPDVVNVTTSNALQLAQSGALVNLREAVPPSVQREYYPNLWEASSWQGGVFAFPWYVSTRVLLYNREILRRSGLDPDSAPNTWDDVARVAGVVHAKGKAYGYEPVIRIVDDLQMSGVPLYEPQTHRATFATSEGTRRLQWYCDLYRRGDIPKDCLIEGPQGALERYKQGGLALLEVGPQQLLKIKADAPSVYANTGVTGLPLSSSGTIPAAQMNLVVPRSSKHRALALELAAWITSPANQLGFAREVPLLPSTWRTAQDKFFREGRGEPLQDEAVRLSLAQLSRAHDMSLNLARSRDLEKILNEAVEASMYGRSTVIGALRNAASEWNKTVGCEE